MNDLETLPLAELQRIAEQGLGQHPMDSAILKRLHEDPAHVQLDVQGDILKLKIPDTNVYKEIPMHLSSSSENVS